MTNWQELQGWLSAIGGPAAALGLLVAAYELRAGRAERLDNEASQARLITIEREETFDPLFFKVSVHNRSGSPVFDVRLDWLGYIEDRGDGLLRRVRPELSFLGQGELGLVTTDKVDDVHVLDAGESIWSGLEWHYPEWFDLEPDRKSLDALIARLDYGMTISFLDTNGRCWQRTNTASPVRVLSRKQFPFWHIRRWWPDRRVIGRKERPPARSADTMWAIEPPDPRGRVQPDTEDG